MQAKILIQEVTADQLHSVRHQVLRPGAPPESVNFDCDHLQETFHLAAVIEKKIIGSATFTPEQHPELKAEVSYRLRGMATQTEFQKQGIGKKLLLQGEQDLKKKGVDLLWFNARANAFAFYEKLGYRYLGEIFDIPGIGPHKVMYKFI